MEAAALVKQAIDRLSPFLPQVAGPVSRLNDSALAARSLYEVVAEILRRNNEDEALREFAAHPADSSLIRRILVDAVETDADLRERMARALAPVAAPAAANVVNQTGNVVGGHQAGRDMVNDHSRTHHSQTTNKRSSNLPLIIALVVGAIIACVIGRSLLTSVGGGLDGSSTCRDYLASSDTNDKVSIMKHLYLDANKPTLAGDPFIVQNTEYFCSNSPDTTLDQLVAARHG